MAYDALFPAPFEEFEPFEAPAETVFTLPASEAGASIMPFMADTSASSLPVESAYGLEALGEDLTAAELAAALAPAEPVAAAASVGAAEVIGGIVAAMLL